MPRPTRRWQCRHCVSGKSLPRLPARSQPSRNRHPWTPEKAQCCHPLGKEDQYCALEPGVVPRAFHRPLGWYPFSKQVSNLPSLSDAFSQALLSSCWGGGACSYGILGQSPPPPSAPVPSCATKASEHNSLTGCLQPQPWALWLWHKADFPPTPSPPAQRLTHDRGRPHSPQPEEGRSQGGQGLGELAGAHVGDAVLGQAAGTQRGEGLRAKLPCPSPSMPPCPRQSWETLTSPPGGPSSKHMLIYLAESCG